MIRFVGGPFNGRDKEYNGEMKRFLLAGKQEHLYEKTRPITGVLHDGGTYHHGWIYTYIKEAETCSSKSSES